MSAHFLGFGGISCHSNPPWVVDNWSLENCVLMNMNTTHFFKLKNQEPTCQRIIHHNINMNFDRFPHSADKVADRRQNWGPLKDIARTGIIGVERGRNGHPVLLPLTLCPPTRQKIINGENYSIFMRWRHCIDWHCMHAYKNAYIVTFVCT